VSRLDLLDVERRRLILLFFFFLQLDRFDASLYSPLTPCRLPTILNHLLLLGLGHLVFLRPLRRSCDDANRDEHHLLRLSSFPCPTQQPVRPSLDRPRLTRVLYCRIHHDPQVAEPRHLRCSFCLRSTSSSFPSFLTLSLLSQVGNVVVNIGSAGLNLLSTILCAYVSSYSISFFPPHLTIFLLQRPRPPQVPRSRRRYPLGALHRASPLRSPSSPCSGTGSRVSPLTVFVFIVPFLDLRRLFPGTPLRSLPL